MLEGLGPGERAVLEGEQGLVEEVRVRVICSRDSVHSSAMC